MISAAPTFPRSARLPSAGSPPVPHDELLHRDVRFLGDMLGSVIREIAGEEAIDLVEKVRTLSRDRRLGRHDAEPALAARIESLDERQATVVARAFSIFFDLVNIAEDRQRVRILHDRERKQHPEPLGESLPAGIAELKSLGAPADDVQKILDRLAVELVQTAAVPQPALDGEARATLARHAEWLKRNPGVRVTVEGHCDERGTREYNLALGDRRANAAKNFLASQGVAVSLMTIISYGKERQAVDGTGEAAWAQNRRAVTVIASR